MNGLERFDKRVSESLISPKVLVYGAIGLGSTLLIYFTSGFAVEHPLLLTLDIFFFTLFSSSMVWTFWEFVLPVTGREQHNEGK